MNKDNHPFQNVALSLSGGGFRAASFHLGSVSYLHHIKNENKSILSNISVISTVSGGTITGILWSLYTYEGKPFESFYKKIFGFLEANNIIDKVITKMENPNEWDFPNKNKNFINAFAELYNIDLFENKKFDTFLTKNESNLKNVIFNAIDMKYGLNFRFQNAGIFGNNRIDKVPIDDIKKIRLGDIAAASSCFPGGFEPIEYPNDFFENNSENYFYLMDGGIVNNQGTYSLELAEKRKGSIPYSLIIVSDVSGKDMKPLMKPEKTESNSISNLSLKKLEYFSWTIILGSILLFFVLKSVWSIVIFTILTTVSILYLSLFYWLRNLLHKLVLDCLLKSQNNKYKNYLQKIESIPIRKIIDFLKIRFSSTSLIFSSIFLRQIRRTTYNSLYNIEGWINKIVANNIYSMIVEENEMDESVKLFMQTHPLSNQLRDIVKEVSNFDTTLWFTEEDEKNGILKKLIACGQFTMCFNLIKYFVRNYKNNEFKEIRDDLEKDFEMFNQDAYWLFNNMNNTMKNQ